MSNNVNLLFALARSSLLELRRDRFLLLMLIGPLIIFFVSLFISELAITEGKTTQLALMATLLRLFAVFSISLFVINSMVREYNDKVFELILSRPVPRSVYYFGKLSGFALIAIFLACLSAVALFGLSDPVPVIIWTLSLYCELLLIIALSMFFLFTFNSITISLSLVASFYLLARSINALLLISHSPILESGTMSHNFMKMMLNGIAYLIPDLDKFTRTDWLVYPLESAYDLSFILIQTIIYVGLLSAAALFDLYRKEM